jgi:hypothetical protein
MYTVECETAIEGLAKTGFLKRPVLTKTSNLLIAIN